MCLCDRIQILFSSPQRETLQTSVLSREREREEERGMDSLAMLGSGSPVFTTSTSASSASSSSHLRPPPFPSSSSSSSSNGLKNGSRFGAHAAPGASTSPPPPSPATGVGGDDGERESLRPAVAILGSGDFSRCLTTRLLRGGFHVVVGSRQPQRAAHAFPHVVDVTHHEDAVAKADLVFLAIRREHYPFLWDLKHLLEGERRREKGRKLIV